MVMQNIRHVVISCALLGAIAVLGAAQEKPAGKNPGTASSRTSLSGAALYAQHCVACHGNDLKGSGPFPSPYRTPPDLSTLARRHGGKFPEAYVASVLRNGVRLPAHGPAEMPAWGTDFEVTDRLDNKQVAMRIKLLSDYLKSLQGK
jgi:mono/diheme cytochrome c family protein